MLPLSDVVPSATNPRKTFDEAKTMELAASIVEKGVLQPILVRPKGKKYELVCGERRYRASKIVQGDFKDRTTIPAVIRDLTDQEVLEIQLIENFQREDVHPLEEAIGIKAALDSGKYNINDIAEKVGKSLKYIRGRLALSLLIPEWQKVFFENRVRHSDAVKIAAMQAKSQKLLFEDEVGDRGEVSLSNWDFEKYRGDLKKAPFALDDANLDKKAGACTNCQFNSTVNKLFPELEESPRCTHIECYKKKCDIGFDKRLAEALEDTTLVLVAHSSEANSATVKRLQKEGHNIFLYGYSEEYKLIEEPELMSFDEMVEDEGYDLEIEEDRKAAENYHAKLKEKYEKEIEAYKANILSSKYCKAFIVAGFDSDDNGRYAYVQKVRMSSSTSSNKKSPASDSGETDFDVEINKIKDRQKRAKELDEIKLWPLIKEIISPKSTIAVKNEDPLSQAEMKGLALAIYDKLNYDHKEAFRKQFKIDDRKKESVAEVTPQDALKMIRFFILSVLPPSMLYHGFDQSALACIEIGRQYHNESIEKLFADTKEKAEKRAARADAKIAQLKKQKSELVKEKNPKSPAKSAKPAKAKK